MISPLTQRQILQTAAVEAVRLSHEGGAQVQREQARKQAFDAKLAESLLDVADVSESDKMNLAEQEAQEREARRQHGTGASEPLPPETPEGTPAEGAGPHLDLLA
ncbi:MAG: hypothetical protein HGB30_04990 [Holophagaceae bacterium]|nr:hypothetical protein [Holophagaceae bacterium]